MEGTVGEAVKRFVEEHAGAIDVVCVGCRGFGAFKR